MIVLEFFHIFILKPLLRFRLATLYLILSLFYFPVKIDLNHSYEKTHVWISKKMVPPLKSHASLDTPLLRMQLSLTEKPGDLCPSWQFSVLIWFKFIIFINTCRVFISGYMRSPLFTRHVFQIEPFAKKPASSMTLR